MCNNIEQKSSSHDVDIPNIWLMSSWLLQMSWRQTISNHHADVTMTLLSHKSYRVMRQNTSWSKQNIIFGWSLFGGRQKLVSLISVGSSPHGYNDLWFFYIKINSMGASPVLSILVQVNELMQAYWHHMMLQIWVNFVSGNGLVPDGTKPLPEPKLTYHQCGSLVSTTRQSYKTILQRWNE